MITDLGSIKKVSCHTKFRFAVREAQCILGGCGPLKEKVTPEILFSFVIANKKFILS